MTFKEKLEILRGEPITEFTGDPMDIPCIETSDAEKLCKHPVVSVHMITYNHEPYIRQAIEGVMMQKTDFEFELIIGEDASQDKTREICFEYQKKYPDKIRVLWWHENVSKFGGNGRRTMARCRGEFIAFCEGDDYWIDPLKLQRQVEILRRYSDINFVYAKCGRIRNCKMLPMPKESSDVFEKYFEDSVRFGVQFVRTPTVLCRANIIHKLEQESVLNKLNLRVSDYFYWAGLAGYSDKIYNMGRVVAIYRQHNGGITADPRMFLRLEGDCSVIRCCLMIQFKLFNEDEAFRVASYICAVRRIYCEEQLIKKVESETWGVFEKSLNDVVKDTEKICQWMLPFYQSNLKIHYGFPSYKRMIKFFRDNNLPFYCGDQGNRSLNLLLKIFSFPYAYCIFRCWCKVRGWIK